MIKNPKSFKWTPHKNGDGNYKGHLRVCPWSRYMLPCSTYNGLCKDCYLYQLYSTPKRQEEDGVEKTIHICDVCGQEITSTPLWVRIRTRSDRTVLDRELCLACAGELIEWLGEKRA